MFTDFISSDIHAQDGNTLAIWFEPSNFRLSRTLRLTQSHRFDVADSPEKVQSISKNLVKGWNEFGAVAPESPQMISCFCSSMELIAHFVARQPGRSMALLRRMWGYIWNAPYSVQSSLIEGFFHDGRCHYPFAGYDPAYISHAHPWASGPTITLTSYLTGLRLLDPSHTKWVIEPQPEETKVTWAMAGVTSTARGFFSAGWCEIGKHKLLLAIKAPKGTTGSIGVPVLGREVEGVWLDEEVVSFGELREENSFLYLDRVEGGEHICTILYKS